MQQALETFRSNIRTNSSDEGPRMFARVLGVKVDAVNMEVALERIAALLQTDEKGYVCAVDVHGVMEALHNPSVAHAFARAALVVPDGTPLAWVGRAQGFRMNPVPGPELMLRVFGDSRFANCTHFLYGGKPGVADDLAEAMRRRFRGARVVGTHTPPFRELNALEESELVREVDALRPDIVWVGISAPRQDLWMNRMLPKLNTKLMFGVGAAFDFNSGRIRSCPPWVKRAGLHWLHRLMLEPRRLWRRNLTNLPFLWHIALQLSELRDYRVQIDQ
jgi:N-acetylglucosaminyldiphosphoundecaprenol N-acetyl-beta-D-mannosaminyltransferase